MKASERFTPEILFEDNHLLIVNKPAGMLTQGDSSDQVSLLEHLKTHIKNRDRKPGNVYLGMVQRLDKPVSGSIVFAKTSKAAARISAQIRAHQMTKCYLAVTEAESDRRWDRDIGTDGWCVVSHNLSRLKDRTIVDDDSEAAQLASLRFKTLLANGKLGIHAVQLITGRKHQIRAQLSALAMPILGDRKYGSSFQPLRGRILLHSYLVQVVHPTRKIEVKVVCSPPEEFFSLFTEQERTNFRSALEEISF
ncbi:MAG: RNA pseudouridine synthase [Desulfofustis sp.]|nr:RNA pseudouridine synthase [Desulfofustis sp.]